MSSESLFDPEDQLQVSDDGRTVWVHGSDGSSVGRFSKVFGLDVHTTVTQQMEGAHQCLHCTHEAPGQDDWLKFIELMLEHHGIVVPPELISFDTPPIKRPKRRM